MAGTGTHDKRAGGIKAIMAAMLANSGIAILKLLAWLLTGAASMLAEAIHSAADAINQVLLLAGDKSARKQADHKHQFGYGRARFITAFLVALLLFSMGGVFALYEAIHKYQEVVAGHGNELLESRWRWVPIVVLVGAIILEFFSLRTALKESKPHRTTMSLWRFIRTAKEPEFIVILLEDIAAMAGLCLALLGIGTALITHNPLFDVIGSACIGVLLIVIAIILAIETKSLLLGESADKPILDKISTYLESIPEFAQVVTLQTLYVAPEEVLVACKVAVNPQAEAADLVRAIAQAEAGIQQILPTANPIYIEIDTNQHDDKE